MRHVHDAAPGRSSAQRGRAPGIMLTPSLADVLDHRQIAALRIGVVAVEIAAEHQPALVRLGDVEVPGAEGDDAVDHRLQRLGDERLQHVAFDRQPQAGHVAPRVVLWPATAMPTLRRADRAARGLDAVDARRPRCRMPVTSQFSMMSTPSRRRRAHSPRPPRRAGRCRRGAAAARRRPGSAPLAKSSSGQSAVTPSRSSSSASMPLQAHGVAAPRRRRAGRRMWNRFSTPRWENITLKLSSAPAPPRASATSRRSGCCSGSR